MRLTLIRHGQTPSNVSGLLDTATPGPGLTPLGKRQAAAIPAAIDGQPVDALFASQLVRTQDTVAPLAVVRGLEVGTVPGLREVVAGDLEMAGDADSIHRYIGTLMAWLEGDLQRRIPGGPSGSEVLERIDSAISEIVTAVGLGGTAVAVSHGAAIRFWASMRGSNAEAIAGEHRHLDNTGAVVLDYTATKRWDVVSWKQAAIGGARLDDPDAAGPTA